MLTFKLKSFLSKTNIKQFSLIFFSIFAFLIFCYYSYFQVPKISLISNLIAGLSLFIVLILAQKSYDETVVMVVVFAILGIFYFLICPFEMPPDEPSHFKRAFEISTGGFFSKPLSNGSFGDILPKSVNDCWNRSAVIDWADKIEISFPNTALYSFVNYIPQSIGIFLTKIFTNKVSTLYYAGRLFNFLSAFFLCVFALKEIPFGKKILFIIMIFPMSLQEMISLSPDALVNALSFAFVAFILNCAYKKQEVKTKDVIIICVMISIIALCKIVYLGAIFLIYIIPRSKLSRRNFYLLRCFVPVFAIFLNFSALIISMKILAKSKIGESNAKEQIKFIIFNPFHYCEVFIKTIFFQIQNWISTCIGSALGRLNIGINYIAWSFFIFMLVAVSFGCNDVCVSLRKTDMIFLGLNFFSGVVLILTSEYIGWTLPRADLIQGVQGRYFIPLLPSLFFPFVYMNYFAGILNNKIDYIKSNSKFLFIFAMVLNFIALVDICKFYPDISQREKATAFFLNDSSSIKLILERMQDYDDFQIAIWSDKDGQDDLHWFGLIGNKTKKIEHSISLESYTTNGKYIVHIYGTKNEKQQFLASTELNIQFSKKTEEQQ